MFYELNKLRALPVPEQELADARNYLSGIFSMGLATQNGLLSQLATIALNDLPDDYLETYRDKLKSLTPSDVLASARKWFTSPDMQIVVVGDRAQIQEQATLFGETTVYDATGTVI
jgi:zinc protease